MTFLTVVTKYKKQLKGEGFILAHDLRAEASVMGKQGRKNSSQQVGEAGRACSDLQGPGSREK